MLYYDKKTGQEEIDAILKAIASMGGQAALKQINEIIEISIHPLTLQRRLKALVDEGRLMTKGHTRSKKYQLQSPLIENSIPSTASQGSRSISLSLESIEIQRWVNQPIHLRQYVNYKREFLDDYQPNVTRYLPESVSEHLLKLGKTDGDRPAGTFARQIFNRLSIDLSWNSSRLEGNTYSLLETERLIELDEMTEGKDLAETQMIRNHKLAIRFLIESVDSIGINRYTILNLHALLSRNLLGNPESCGQLRSIPVGIAKTVYLPTAIHQLIDECFLAILEKGRIISNPFEQAFFLMVHLPYLQPFEDVNKRVSRLAVNIPLIRSNLCPLSFVNGKR